PGVVDGVAREEGALHPGCAECADEASNLVSAEEERAARLASGERDERDMPEIVREELGCAELARRAERQRDVHEVLVPGASVSRIMDELGVKIIDELFRRG